MNIFSFVKSHVSIIEVIGQYSSLKKAGHYYRAVCPLHVERTASFTVSSDKNIFYCFGCHVGGDVISFIAKIENCSPLEAAYYLIERYNLELPKELSIKNNREHEEKKRSYYHLCSLVAAWCRAQRERSHKAQEYITTRGITKENLEQFTLGYFPGTPRAIASLIEYVKSGHFLAEDLIAAKIIMENNRSWYSPFEERIIFPIYDHLSRCCGFGGRVFLPNDTRVKYYNTHENEFFNKGSILFGFDRAKKAIAQSGAAIIVEGYVDCIAMVHRGWNNTVATLGTACSLEHLRQLARYAKNLYVLFDGDKAGRRAMYRLTELCWMVDLDLSIVTLPDGMDPASFLAAGGNLEERIKNAEDIMIFFVQSLADRIKEKGLQERLELARHFTKIIARLDDSLKQDFLIHRAARAFEIPPQTLRQEMNKEKKLLPELHEYVQEHKKHGRLASITSLEKKLFSAILNNVNSLKREDELYVTSFVSEPLRQLLVKILAARQREHLSFERVYEMLDEDEKQWVSGLVLEWPTEDIATLHTLMLQLAKKHWKNMVSEVTTKLKYAQQNNDKQKIAALLHEFQELKVWLQGRGLI